uniref:Uncharacterized protein n=1 Tax=Salix viminalis TaxID=40686 RepID=A0A6N2LI06_SALVM
MSLLFPVVCLLYHMKVPAVEEKFPPDILSRLLECISRNILEDIYQISACWSTLQIKLGRSSQIMQISSCFAMNLA